MEKTELEESGGKFISLMAQASKDLETKDKAVVCLGSQDLATLVKVGLFADFQTLRAIGFNVPEGIKKNSFMVIESGEPTAKIGNSIDGKETPMAAIDVSNFEGVILNNRVRLNNFGLVLGNAPHRLNELDLLGVTIDPDISFPKLGNLKSVLFGNFHHEFIMWPLQRGITELFRIQGRATPKGVDMTIISRKGAPESEKFVQLTLYRDKETRYPLTTIVRALLPASAI